MMGFSDITGGDFNLKKNGLDRQMRANRKVLMAAITFLEIVVLGAAACGPTTALQNLEQTPLPPGQTLVETNPTNNPLDDPVKIQPIETVGSFEPAINPPEYSISGDSIEGLTADQQNALLAKAVFPVFRQKLIDSGQLQVGDPYFFEGADQQAAQLTFEAEMKSFLQLHPELSVRMNQQAGEVLAFVEEKMPDGSTAIKFAFKQDGALAYAEPNWFEVDTVAGNVSVRKGYRAEFIYNPNDKHWYLFEIDEKTGQADTWFKTNGATRDNLEGQWKEYVAPDRLVQTDRGPVYLNDEERLILVDPKYGENPVGIESLDFDGIQGASDIVRAMYPKEFEQNQFLTRNPDIALRDFLYPPGLEFSRSLKYLSIDKIVTGDDPVRGKRSFAVYGEVLGVTMVKGQITLFLAVPGCHEPVPFVITKEGTGFSFLAIFRDPTKLGSDEYIQQILNNDPITAPQRDARKIDSQLRGKRILADFLTQITAPEGSSAFENHVQEYGDALNHDDYFGEETSLVMQALSELEAEGAEVTQGSVLQRAIELAASRPEWTGFLPFSATFAVFKD